MVFCLFIIRLGGIIIFQWCGSSLGVEVGKNISWVNRLGTYPVDLLCSIADMVVRFLSKRYKRLLVDLTVVSYVYLKCIYNFLALDRRSYSCF